jgi:hypothetical protein
MKKPIVLLFCLCVALAVFGPGVVSANPAVDDTGCVACHTVSDLHSLHTNCAACHDGSPAKGNVASSTCLACHPAPDSEKCDLVASHENSASYTPPEGTSCLDCHGVAISPANVNLAPGAIETFQATTDCGDNTPAYTWEVQGGTAGTGNTTTGDSIEYTAGNTPGDYTITVTDTANGNIQATAAVTIEAEVTCSIVLVRDQLPKSHWVALPGLIRILTTGFEISQATEVTFTSDNEGDLESVIPLVKLVNPTMGIINQIAIIPPALLTGNFDAESETITVAVEGCAQTVALELKLLSAGPIPLSK